MPYGGVKIDNITFTNAGVDANITVSGLYAGITSGVTVTGTVSGNTIQGQTVSGVTVTGATGNFATANGTTVNFVSGVFTTQLSGATVTGNTGQFTNITGVAIGATTITGTTVTGTTANFASGVFTTQLSGATITGNTGNFTSLTAVTGTFTTRLSGATVTGNTGQFTNITGVAIGATTITGITVTGTTANFVTGVFTTQLSGVTVTGTTASFTSGVFTTLTGGTIVVGSGSVTTPSLSFSGDSNTGLYTPSGDVFGITTSGTGKLTVDNTTAPVKEVSSGIFYPIATQVDIGTDANQIPLNQYLGTMAFQDSAGVNVDLATISSAAITAFSNVPLLTGGGLKFPPTQVASADPNTLNDYEEGTFTPAVAGSTTAGTGTYVTRSGRYTKTGNRVYYQIWMEYSGHTGTGDFTVTGLPFTTNSTVYSWNPVIIYTSGIAFTASHFTQGFVERNSTIVYVQSCPTGGGAAASVPMDPAGSIMLGGHYEV